jgi:hypothetical protein
VACHAPTSSEVPHVVIELSNEIGTHIDTPQLITIPNPLSKSTSPAHHVAHCTEYSTIPPPAQILTLKNIQHLSCCRIRTCYPPSSTLMSLKHKHDTRIRVGIIPHPSLWDRKKSKHNNFYEPPHPVTKANPTL